MLSLFYRRVSALHILFGQSTFLIFLKATVSNIVIGQLELMYDQHCLKNSLAETLFGLSGYTDFTLIDLFWSMCRRLYFLYI